MNVLQWEQPRSSNWISVTVAVFSPSTVPRCGIPSMSAVPGDAPMPAAITRLRAAARGVPRAGRRRALIR